MPPKGRAPRKASTAKNTTASEGGNAEPERFTAGSGYLADGMRGAAEDAALVERHEAATERSRVAAKGVTLQRLGEDGQPVGEPQHVAGSAEVQFAPDDSGINQRFEEAFEAAQPAGDPVSALRVGMSGVSEALERLEGAENPQVAPVPAGNIEAGSWVIDPESRPLDLTPREMEFTTSDPAAVAMIRELTRIPIPTAVIAEWFPAYFRPPGEEQPWPTCKVFLTPQGLYVYRSAPAEKETFKSGAQPQWYAGVNFAKTAKPVTGYAAMNAGIPIMTDDGGDGQRVNVQPFPSCGCTARKLKNWTPSWSRTRISWADAVKLTDTTAGR